jgi:hypothetical protein
MGSLGYWFKLKNAKPTQLLQQGLAILFTNMENSLIPSVVGSGISQQYLKNFNITYAGLLSPAGISK